MPNYSKSIIYKICCKDLLVTAIYIGSTTNFTKRKNNHKQNCNNEKYRDYNRYVYKFIRDHGGWCNWDIVEIEQYDAEDKKELHTRERFWIKVLKSTLNKQIPLRSRAEYEVDNKDKKALYYQNNKGKITEKMARYRQNNRGKIIENNKVKATCQCGAILNKINLSRHRRTKKHHQ